MLAIPVKLQLERGANRKGKQYFEKQWKPIPQKLTAAEMILQQIISEILTIFFTAIVHVFNKQTPKVTLADIVSSVS